MDISDLIVRFIAAVILVLSGLGYPTHTSPDDSPAVIVLGDSYAEGFGVAEASTFRNALWPGTINLASTGVATYEMESQFRRLHAEIVTGFVPDAAIVILGGNDLDLISALQKCFLSECPTAAQMRPRLTSLRPNLVTIFQEIDDITNTPELQTARGGALAPVLVGSYPIMLRTDGPVNIGPIGVSEINAERINQIVVELNNTVEQAAHDAGGQIRFVDLEAIFAGHRFGDPEPFMSVNGHPNAAGYQAILAEFARALKAN